MDLLRLFFILCFLVSCSGKEEKLPESSFYYWRTSFVLNESEVNVLKRLNSNELYVRFFDVDKKNDSIVPVSPISDLSNFPEFIEIVPVVFITNRTFVDIRPDQLSLLVKRVHAQITSLLKQTKANCNKVQIDCDWSGATKKSYFLFLSELKKRFQTKKLSVTIRLHQTKYAQKTGIPPADEGVLMYYNIGSLGSDSLNSIFNGTDAKKYAGYARDYPLPLDIALPIFSWTIHSQAGKVKNLMNDQFNFGDTASFQRINSALFKVRKAFLKNGYYYSEGDELKLERLNEKELKDLARIASQDFQKGRTVIFYHLDETNLKNYDEKIFEEVLTDLN